MDSSFLNRSIELRLDYAVQIIVLKSFLLAAGTVCQNMISEEHKTGQALFS